jgi:hypothetical protein
MSEHRSRYSSRSDHLTGRCQFWPECECARMAANNTLYSVVARMADERFPPPTPEEVEIIETKVFMTLSCVSVNCPVSRLRRQAQIELMKPYYDRQRRIGMQG